MPPPPLTHWVQGQHPLQGVLPLRAVCSEVFPWSIKSAPPAIPFDSPVAGMPRGAKGRRKIFKILWRSAKYPPFLSFKNFADQILLPVVISTFKSFFFTFTIALSLQNTFFQLRTVSYYVVFFFEGGWWQIKITTVCNNISPYWQKRTISLAGSLYTLPFNMLVECYHWIRIHIIQYPTKPSSIYVWPMILPPFLSHPKI